MPRPRQRLCSRKPVVPPAILLRRSACEAVGAFFDGTFQYCDWELWARLASRFPAYYLARRDNDFRRHATTYTYGTREKPAQLLAMADHIELMYARAVDGFGLGRIERARVQSGSCYGLPWTPIGRGWTTSRGDVPGRAPTVSADDFHRASLTMLAKSILGHRGTRLVGAARNGLRGRRATQRPRPPNGPASAGYRREHLTRAEALMRFSRT